MAACLLCRRLYRFASIVEAPARIKSNQSVNVVLSLSAQCSRVGRGRALWAGPLPLGSNSAFFTRELMRFNAGVKNSPAFAVYSLYV